MLLYVVALVETGHHKSGAVVFHGCGCCGLNLLGLGNFILRLLSDVMCSTLEPLRSGWNDWRLRGSMRCTAAERVPRRRATFAEYC